MFLPKNEVSILLKEFTSSMSSELKHKTDFMLSLFDTDDWSMIIKSHALIESIVTELIIAKTEEPNLKMLIERLPLSDEQIGKLKIAKDYNILTKEQRKFIRHLSELRNMIVHKFENVDFNFNEYVKSFDRNKEKSWLKTIIWYSNEKEIEEKWEKISIENPIFGLWFSIMMFVSLTIISVKELEGSTEIKKLSEETLDKLFKSDIL